MRTILPIIALAGFLAGTSAQAEPVQVRTRVDATHIDETTTKTTLGVGKGTPLDEFLKITHTNTPTTSWSSMAVDVPYEGGHFRLFGSDGDKEGGGVEWHHAKDMFRHNLGIDILETDEGTRWHVGGNADLLFDSGYLGVGLDVLAGAGEDSVHPFIHGVKQMGDVRAGLAYSPGIGDETTHNIGALLTYNPPRDTKGRVGMRAVGGASFFDNGHSANFEIVAGPDVYKTYGDWSVNRDAAGLSRFAHNLTPEELGLNAATITPYDRAGQGLVVRVKGVHNSHAGTESGFLRGEGGWVVPVTDTLSFAPYAFGEKGFGATADAYGAGINIRHDGWSVEAEAGERGNESFVRGMLRFTLEY